MTPQELLARHGCVDGFRDDELDNPAIVDPRAIMSAILDALSQPASPDMVSVPKGYVLVPTEPTEPMIMASGNTENRARDDWRRMLSRAPKDTADEQG